jgi:hypothetical protein
LPALKRLAGLPSVAQASTVLLTLAATVSIAAGSLTASRILRVEHDLQPTLDDVRLLDASLDATRQLLRDGRLGNVESRIARADSQAQRFHQIASTPRGAEQRAQMLAYDIAFGEYYVAARRAAAGLSMSAEALGSSAEDARLGYFMLRQNLEIGVQSFEGAIDAARPGTAPVELAGCFALALLSAAALLRRTASRTQEWPLAARQAVQADRRMSLVEDEDQSLRLHDAVERLARQRLAASVAAAKVAKRNNDRQIEVARSWNAPLLSIVPPTGAPAGGMDVYEDEQVDSDTRFGGLALVTA